MRSILSLLLILFISINIHSQKILFVGNSLTYANGTPLILEEIGILFNKEINTKMICKPNYAIIDHLDEGIVQQEIASKKYDWVIVQQGPSSQELGKKMLIEDAEKLAKLCAKYNTKLGYLMVWPAKRHYYTFDKVMANYTEAATKNKAFLFPVGKYWKQYEKLPNKISLYSNDAFHPSKIGSLLTALTIFKELYPKENLQKLLFKDVSFWAEHLKSYQLLLQTLEID